MRIISASEHYDLLIDENNDPVNDTEPLQNYMDKWDGDLFITQLKINSNSNVLEIGVGTGRLALKVLEIGCKEFTGIDISPKTIARANEHLNKYENCTLICADYLEYDATEQYDIIYSSLTFFHIENKELAINKTYNLLNNSGRFILSIEKHTDPIFEYGSHSIRMFPDHKETTLKLISKNGFNIDRVLETEFAYIIVAMREPAMES